MLTDNPNEILFINGSVKERGKDIRFAIQFKIYQNTLEEHHVLEKSLSSFAVSKLSKEEIEAKSSAYKVIISCDTEFALATIRISAS